MPRRFPPFAAIRAFESAARLGKQKEAAEELGISISAISHQIRALESYVGARLLERKGNAHVLTRDGERLLASLTATLNQLEAAFGGYPNQAVAHPLKIQMYQPFANLWLIPQLRQFTELFPDIPVTVISSSKRPREAEVDLAVIYAKSRPHRERCDRLFEEVISPVCSPETLAKLPDPLEPDNLLKTRLISSVKYPDAWKDWMRAAGIGETPRQPTLTVDNLAASLQAAINGIGWAMDMRPLGEWYKAQGVLVAPFAETHRTGYSYYLTMSKRSVNQPSALRFREWLLSLCQSRFGD